MFDLYGPNSILVNSYIQALHDLTTEQLEAFRIGEYEFKRIKAILGKVNHWKDFRKNECENAKKNAEEAIGAKGFDYQQLLFSEIAVWLVLNDWFEIDDRYFIQLYLINPIIPLKELRKDYEKEDWAVEIFCDRLSKIDGQRVFIKSRPDARGKGSTGLPDFVISRKGMNYTVEHTSIDSYDRQTHYRKLWEKYFKPFEIEQKIQAKFPNKWIRIDIPIDAFKSENMAKKYDFNGFLNKLFEYVEETIIKAPITHHLSKPHIYEFKKPDFQVLISVGEGYNGCRVVGIAPTSPEQIEKWLSYKIAESIKKKQSKLKSAKDNGENTVLLLDSDDYAFVNVDILAKAFSQAADKNQDILDGIDEVFILHRGGSGIVVPVKLGVRLYPDLPEYNDYIFNTLKLSYPSKDY
jgi:hypothetical protein